MKKLVVLTGAGISAESGLKTFRDADGLWEGHDVMQVASIDGWRKNPELVLDFYNRRRRQLQLAQPNTGHMILAELEQDFDVRIITQNVDDLHERAGSSNVLHLHGELLKARSVEDETRLLKWTGDLVWGDCDENGCQLRPHIVWFGEMVPALEEAVLITREADFLVIVGTSLQVYPAASLIHYARHGVPVFYIDPKPATIPALPNSVAIIPKPASQGMADLRETLHELK